MKLYEVGAKKISVRTTRLKLTKEPFELKMEPSYRNYDLYFNKQGRLLHSVHPEKHSSSKVFYGYDKKGKLVTALTLQSETSVVVSTSSFSYDVEDKIEKEVCQFWKEGKGFKILEKRTYLYTSVEDAIFITNYEVGKKELMIRSIHAGNNKPIEEYTTGCEGQHDEWLKFEYDDNWNLVKKISLNKKGEPNGIHEYFSSPPRLEQGYKYTSKVYNYMQEYTYIYNDKGHWITEVLMRDGIPSFNKERKIEYY